MRQPGQKVVLGRMADLQRQRQRPRRAHVAENDDGPDDFPLSVVYRGDRVLDGDLKSVTPDEDAVQRQAPGSA